MIKCVAFDTSLRNLGIAFFELCPKNLTLNFTDIELHETEKTKLKQVRQNSDDLKRAIQIKEAVHEACKHADIAFAEIPTGAQSARAALSFGIAIGVLASCPIPLIEVQPSETKLAAVGTKTASKQEMIEWAIENHPTLPWIKRTVKGKTKFVDKNEHMADAVAIAYAGIKTQQFKSLLAMLKK